MHAAYMQKQKHWQIQGMLNFSFHGNYSLHSLPLCNACKTSLLPVHWGPYSERKGSSPPPPPRTEAGNN